MKIECFFFIVFKKFSEQIGLQSYIQYEKVLSGVLRNSVRNCFKTVLYPELSARDSQKRHKKAFNIGFRSTIYFINKYLEIQV